MIQLVVRPRVRPHRGHQRWRRTRRSTAIDTTTPHSRANRGEDARGSTTRRYNASSTRIAHAHAVTAMTADPMPTTISDMTTTVVISTITFDRTDGLPYGQLRRHPLRRPREHGRSVETLDRPTVRRRRDRDESVKGGAVAKNKGKKKDKKKKGKKNKKKGKKK